MPLISIITVCYNAESVIEKTLTSIEKQNCRNFEFLIIDGKSTDKTLEIVKKYKCISIVISEPDNGIYDAMNKGLSIANGDFLWYMNAGDELVDETIICRIQSAITAETDLVYGDAVFINEHGVINGLRSKITPHKIWDQITWRDLKYGMKVCHQSLLVKRAIASEYIMDNLSADVDWEIKAFKSAKNKVFLNYPLSKYLEGGVSNQNLKKSIIDRFKVLQFHFGFFPNLLNHLIIIVRGLCKALKIRGKYW